MYRNITNIALVFAFALSACAAQPTPLPTPTSTATPNVTPTITPSPTNTPFPTPVPVVRIGSGDQALFYGDYESARAEYRSAYENTTDNALKAAALWGLGHTELESGNFQAAVETLITLTNEYPESTYAARAYFLLGRAYDNLKQYQQAADAYETYTKRVPGVLDGYVQEYRGDDFYALGDYTNAINAYEAALNASRLDDGLSLRIKTAQTRFDFGDFAGALSLYEQIYTTAPDDFVRARMDYLIGKTYARLEQNDPAYSHYLHAVDNYPTSEYSYLALIELVNANIAVDDLNRGLVDYFAGQYDIALVALERYIKNNPTHDGTASYYRALTLKEMDRTQNAITALDEFIKAYPSHPRWVEAWDEKATLEWVVLGDNAAGIQTMLDFVAYVPSSPYAPNFLMTAARVMERDNKLEEAAQLWERVANEYSSSDKVPEALFLAGIMKYRLSDYNGALTLFQRDLLLAYKAEDRARAYFWMGKAQEKLEDTANAEKSWQQAQLADPQGYYSLRAEDILLHRPVFESSSTLNMDVDFSKERKDAEAWVRVTFNLPAETDLSGPGTLAQDARFIRGTELWELGMYGEAWHEFDALREAVQLDAADSFRLANHLLDKGLYRPAIFAAREVLNLAGLKSQSDSLTAPAYFKHIRYGLYYKDLILAEETRYNLDPLFIFSVIRQESLFEGFARSFAGAQGLMQIIPSTGYQISREINWPRGFTPEDLHRPSVSVRFGAYYLDQNRRLLGGSLYGSLAAYNAGPGNALAWKGLAGDDPDLFLEIIRYQETRDYIRYIYEMYNIYRTTYSPFN